MKHWQSCILGIAALLSLACSPALADPMFRYVEAGYLGVSPEDFDKVGHNFYGEASWSLFQNFHISGRYIDGEYTDNLDLSLWKLAAGWHGMLGDRGDLLGELTWTDQEIGNISDDGVGLTAGIRFTGIQILELDGLIHWTDYSDLGSEDSYELRGIFHIWRGGLGAAGEFSGDDTRYNVFARFDLGR